MLYFTYLPKSPLWTDVTVQLLHGTITEKTAVKNWLAQKVQSVLIHEISAEISERLLSVFMVG